MRPLLLLFGDDPAGLESLYRLLKRDRRDVLCCHDPDEALRLLGVEPVSICLPVVSRARPLGWLRRARRAAPEADFLVLCREPSMALAVQAMRLGARNVLELPAPPVRLLAAVEEILAARGVVDAATPPTLPPTPAPGVFAGIVGSSPAIHDILELVRKVGPSQATVLLEGESGTGKELIAQAIQECSTRRQQPFVRVNCAALPETLMESELFGHERGAFTGAVRSRPGRFELADKGTLFLDEIGDMSLSTQTKLLRVLQEGDLDRVGGTGTRRVDVRVIAATNIDLAKAVRQKRFREDLYYRLRVVQLRVPSLRERRGDIPQLVEYFVQCFAQRDGKRIEGVDADVLHRLLEHPWPGNVRELENTIERGVALTEAGPLLRSCLPPEFQERQPVRQVIFPIGTSLEEIERRMIAETLRYTDGDKKQAATLLGITVRTIYRKLERRRRDMARWAVTVGTRRALAEATSSAAAPEPEVGEGRLDTTRRAGP